MKTTTAMAMVVAAGLVGAFSAFADGIPVVDAAANTSLAAQLVEEVKATGDRAMDYAQQLAQYAELVNTYVNAVENTVGIPMAAIARVQGYYYRAEGMAQQAAAIAGSGGTMMQRASMLRGLSRNGGHLPGDAGRTASMLRTQMSKQIDEDQRLLGIEAERKAANDSMLRSAQDNSAEAVGRMAAIQAQSQVTASAAAQLQQTNALLAQQAATQLVKDSAAQADDEQHQADMAAGSAQMQEMLAHPAFMNSSPVRWGR